VKEPEELWQNAWQSVEKRLQFGTAYDVSWHLIRSRVAMSIQFACNTNDEGSGTDLALIVTRCHFTTKQGFFQMFWTLLGRDSEKDVLFYMEEKVTEKLASILAELQTEGMTEKFASTVAGLQKKD